MAKLIIEAGRTERNYWRDLWRYRELFVFLAWRDLLIRYKQTAVGVAWAIVRPFLTMLILTVMMKFSQQHGDGTSPVPLFSALSGSCMMSTKLTVAAGTL